MSAQTCFLRRLTLAIGIATLLGGCARQDPDPPPPSGSTRTLAQHSRTHDSITMTDSTNAPTPERRETAVLAGGCFWGVEDLIRALPGVISTDVGYTGGHVAQPTYSDVKTGHSGHAEAVSVVFDPAVLSFERLLLYFFKIHDPTTKNRQGNDVGTQYRSAIFTTTEEQAAAARAVIAKVNESGDWRSPVTTEVVSGGEFTRAEEYHQDYLQKHPNGYTCHFERDVSYF
jgi:methionine-S-sulfoxide reductase